MNRGCPPRREGTPGTPRSNPGPGLGEHRPEDLLDLVEVGLLADQRRGELDDRVAAVVGPAVEAGVEQRRGQEAAQQPLGLVVVEGLLGRLVLDQFDAVEVAVAADVADDRQVVQAAPGWTGTRPRWRVRARAGPRARRCRGWPARPRRTTGCPPKVTPCGERVGARAGTARPAGRRRSSRRAGVAGGHALGAGDDVGLVAVALGAEVLAEPAERADHLVGDEQHVVARRRSPVPAGSSRAAAGSSRRSSAPAPGRPRRPCPGPRTRSPRSISVGGPAAERLASVVAVRRAPGRSWCSAPGSRPAPAARSRCLMPGRPVIDSAPMEVPW